MQKDFKLLFIVNPIAGGKEKKDWETAIREFFKDSSYTLDFFTQTGKDDQPAIKAQMDRLKPDVAVAVGGDGTVKMVAELLRDTNVRLGIIPAGSANGLAKELGIPTTVNEAIEIILTGESKRLDAICINEKELCFHLSDIGLNALLVKYFERSGTRGFWGYGQSLFKMFWNRKKMRVAIKTDNEELKRTAYMVVLANAEKYGTGAIINPDGDVGDGDFEVVLVRKLHPVEIVKAVMAKKNFHPQRIESFRTKKLSLRFQQKFPFQIDGEYMGKISSLDAQILPGLVHVMVPAAKLEPQVPA